MRCCIMVPINARIAIPVAVLVGLFVVTHLIAMRPMGEIRTPRATKCNQKKGRAIVPVPVGTSMNKLVFGCIRKAASNMTFRAITCIHFFLIKNPKDTAATVAGKKSKPKKTGGFPNMAMKEPKTTLSPPMYGPNIMP